MTTLAGKVALVTGSTLGIGRGIAEHFARLGAQLVISGRDDHRGAAVVESIEQAGGEATFVQADLTDEQQCKQLVQATEEHYHRLDILVNNAGNTSRGTVDATTVDLWDTIMAVNLRAPFILMQAAIPVMKAGGGGSIVNIGSVNAYIGEPKLTAYSTSKGGLMTLTKNVASQVGQHGIRVNLLNVGWTLTEGERRVKAEEEGLGPEWVEEAEATRPFGRLMTPQDVAYAAAYFASDASALVSGTVMDLEQFPVGGPPNW